ncbi:MAG: S9 family peptidase, partial [Candidatus Sulfopaludibacter sp.]|nr:S9 family peptidase [Candidatus Sulfopaludibacter sp.]
MTLCLISLAVAPALWAQGTLADYQRAQGLQRKARGLVVDSPGTVEWIGKSGHFWYPRTVKGGTEFLLVDAAAGSKKPAFDHDKLAAAISTATGHACTGLTLPFAPQAGRGGGGGRAAAGAPQTAPLTFADDEQSISFGTGGSMYKCSLTGYTCTKGGAIPQNAGRGARGVAPQEDPAPEYLSEEGGDPADGLEYQPFPQQGGAG